MVGTRGRYLYLLALGSNRALSARLTPRALLKAATDQIGATAGVVIATGPIITTPPVGPSLRRFANGALLLASDLEPESLLRRLQSIERRFGRRRARRWGARRLDIDIILWSGGIVRQPRLTIPHVDFRHRNFVLTPATAIAPDWRDPVTGLSLRHLHARLHKRRANG